MVIRLCVTPRFRAPVADFLEGAGAPLAPRVKIVGYRNRAWRFPLGTTIFADLERLPRRRRRTAERWERRLRAEGARVLNSPARSLRRFELLTRLHELGINGFRAFRRDGPWRTARFPVFLRHDDDHAGPVTDLLPDADALRRAWDAHPRAIAVEFCDTRSPDGLYRKYAVFRVGDRLLARHVFFGRHWIVKHAATRETLGADAAHLFAEECRWVARHPDEETLRRIFDLAAIDYGRVDYGKAPDGRIAVYEINTNPQIVTPGGQRIPERDELNAAFARRFNEAVAAL